MRKDDNDRGEAAEDGATALRPFTPFLTSMLDHLHNMTTGQVRRLFLLLFAVGLGGGDTGEGAGGEASMQDISGTDVGIVIQKHLSLAPFAKKRIVSSCVVVWAFLNKRPDFLSSSITIGNHWHGRLRRFSIVAAPRTTATG